MKVKPSLFMIVVLFGMMMSGCSWVYNFIILNRSEEVVTISYKLKGETGIFLDSPVISKNEIADTTRNIAIQDSIVKFDLYPGEQARIAEGINTSLKDVKSRKGYYSGEFNLAWLRIKTKNEVKEYTLDNIESGLTTNDLALSEIRIK